MEIIKNFGLNPVLLGAQVFNFLIILFLLKKFLYKPVFDLLKKRQNTIAEGLKQAEDARIKLEKVVIEEKHILNQAQLQSRKIIEDAKLESVEIAKRVNEETKKQTEKLLSETKRQIARESVEAEKRLAVKTSKIAALMLEKALKKFFSPEDQKKIIYHALKKIKKAN